MKVLLIDNYDSFTYNVYQYLSMLGASVRVERNDAISVADIAKIAPDAIVISPGPGEPKDAGITVDTIKTYCGKIPLLGICLGHQAIGYAFGGDIIRAGNIMHGKTSQITHDGRDLFAGVPNPCTATRYHSLVIKPETCPAALEVTAHADSGEIMGVRVKGEPCWGLQFHPESILTGEGMKMMENFLAMAKGAVRA
jgi:anthranilate synthase component 2